MWKKKLETRKGKKKTGAQSHKAITMGFRSL